MRLTKYILKILIACMAFSACQPEKTDLSKLPLTQNAAEIICFTDNNKLGVDRISIPFDVIIETWKSNAFSFGDVPLKDANISFQIFSNKFRTDMNFRNQHAQYEVAPFTNAEELKVGLLPFQADAIIYGFQLEMKAPNLKASLLAALIKLYGKGTKNPNTDNGLYWVVPSESKYIFYAVDYDRLIVLNNTKLSKTCYYDNMNGTIDLGGCDKDAYLKELTK